MVSNFKKVRLKDQISPDKLVLSERYLELGRRTTVRSILDLREHDCPGGSIHSDLANVEREILIPVLNRIRNETNEKVKKYFLVAARLFARKIALYRSDFYTHNGELMPKLTSQLPAFSDYLLAEVRLGVYGHYPNIGRALAKYSFDEVRDAYQFLRDNKSSVVREFAPTILNSALGRVNLEDAKKIAARCEKVLNILKNDELEVVSQNARSILYGAIRRYVPEVAIDIALETPYALAQLWLHPNEQVRSRWRDILNKVYLSGNLENLTKFQEKCIERSEIATRNKSKIIRKNTSLVIRMSLGEAQGGDELIAEIKQAHKKLKASRHAIVREKADEIISVAILRRNLKITNQLANDLPAAHEYVMKNSIGKIQRFNNRIISAAIQENNLNLVRYLVPQVKEEYEKLLRSKSSYVKGNAPSLMGRLIRDNKIRDAQKVAQDIVEAEKLIRSKRSNVANQYDGTLISSFVSSKWTLEKLNAVATELPKTFEWLKDSKQPKIVRDTKKKIMLATIKSGKIETAKKLAQWATKKEKELHEHASPLIRSNSTKIIKNAILSSNLARAEKLVDSMITEILE